VGVSKERRVRKEKTKLPTKTDVFTIVNREERKVKRLYEAASSWHRDYETPSL